MTVIAAAFVTVAVFVALKTLGRPIGDAAKPASPNPPPATFYPYGVVFVGTVSTAGTLLEPHETGLHRVQVSCIGRTRESAEVFRDTVRALLLNPNALTIVGHAVVFTEHAGSPEVMRDDDVSPPLFVAPVVVNLFVTPV